VPVNAAVCRLGDRTPYGLRRTRPHSLDARSEKPLQQTAQRAV